MNPWVMSVMVSLALVSLGCASLDPRCEYESEMAAGSPSLNGGSINLAGRPGGLYNLAMRQGHVSRLYDLCMQQRR